MIQTSEYCAVGHPDRTCDYIASFLLDRWLEKDIFARVALEVQLKDHFCTVSGEVSSAYRFTDTEIADFCRAAVAKIGYTKTYQNDFGAENAICATDLDVTVHISQQSGDIAQGVNSDGWGDQGIFWGLAVDAPFTGDLPLDYHLARKVAQDIVSHDIGGVDVKTQVTVKDGKPVECVVAVPLTEWMPVEAIEKTVRDSVGPDCSVIINGTGRYVKHGSIGDCGTTGRKLVVDFYGGNCRIGGGSPWGKDPTKADVTLNIYARKKALEYLHTHNLELVQCAISCCIGRKEITVSFFDKENRLLETTTEEDPPSHIIESLGLRYPGYADRCEAGLFGYE